MESDYDLEKGEAGYLEDVSSWIRQDLLIGKIEGYSNGKPEDPMKIVCGDALEWEPECKSSSMKSAGFWRPETNVINLNLWRSIHGNVPVEEKNVSNLSEIGEDAVLLPFRSRAERLEERVEKILAEIPSGADATDFDGDMPPGGRAA